MLDDDFEEERKAAYKLCAELYGKCPCQQKRSGPCDWMMQAVDEGMTLAKVKREMTLCRNAI